MLFEKEMKTLPNLPGTRTEMFGAAAVQNAVFNEQTQDGGADEKALKAIIDKINALSVKYSGLSDATTVSGALANVEAVIRNLEGQIPELVSLSVSANDTYTAPSGTAYNEVVVNVQ
jgi:hypothetical protein